MAAATGDEEVVEKTDYLFEENFKELKKWVDVKSSKYGTLLVIREQRSGRLGSALKVPSFHLLLFCPSFLTR